MTATSEPDDLIVCSFHTDDAYYTAAGDRLRASLDRIGVAHEVRSIAKPEGADWIDICRQKIPFLHEICQKYPDRKVFWIDGDCELEFLPDFVRNTTADIIGFQRGFSNPMTIGYHKRSRFWEPCFWGINTTPLARAYIQSAHDAEKQITLRATDDYFFEEAWRMHAPELTFQIIPSAFVGGRSDSVAPFFLFGSSGNVGDFKGKASQHGSADDTPSMTFWARVNRRLRRESEKYLGRDVLPTLPIGKSEVAQTRDAPVKLPPVWQELKAMVDAGKAGDKADAEAALIRLRERKLLTPGQNHAVTAMRSFLHYATPENGAGSDLRLLWWERPYPGNFGDWLSPLIFRDAAEGARVLHVVPEGNDRQPHIVGIGSIARFTNAYSVVAGAGVSALDADVHPKATYISLRGPISADVVRKAGGQPSGSFGDPGVLMSRIFPQDRNTTNGQRALVRHYAHRKMFLRVPDGMDDLDITMCGPAEIAAFVGKLAKYDSIVTSAMHIYIICHSYGIPCALVTFEGGEGMVHGDGTKYIDYARGAGVPEAAPVPVGIDLRDRDFDNLTQDYRISEAKMDEVADALKQAIAAYRAQG